MRLNYVLGEIGTGLRRNLTMTIAVVVTVAISLSLLGAGLLIRQQANTMKDYWYDRIEVSVFMCNAFDSGETCASGQVTEDQKALIESTIRSNPEVEDVFYESQDAAYALFQERFQDSIADNITADQLQESFRIKLADPEEYESVVSAVAGLEGVQQVVDQRQLLDKFFKLLNGIQTGALVIAGLALLAAVLLVSNTVRVAAFSRRRETGIMRLVGASNFYIQLPFVLEAAIAGLIGALLACGAIALLEALFVLPVLVPAFPFTAFVGWGNVLSIFPLLLLAGVAMAAIAGFITLRRYLRV
jgi:cell division transport system permease protein